MAMRTKRRDRAKERFWRQTLKQFRQSGLSVRLFCGQEGLAESAFYFWRRELQKRDAENAAARRTKSATSKQTNKSLRCKPSRRPAFAAVTVAVPEVGAHHADEHEAIEVVVRDSFRVRVPRGFDAQTLRDLLAVLEERPC